MKDILKKVGGLFVEIEDTPVKKPPKSVPIHTVQETVIPVAVVDSDVNTFSLQFRKILADENQRNYPGNDYYEFVTMKNAMSAIPQEDVQYKAAFAGWSVGGNQTKDSLIKTANIYLSLVDKEIKDFEQEYKLQVEEKVTKNQRIIELKTQEMNECVERINKLNSEISQLKDANLQATAKLTSSHSSFTVAADNQRKEILEEINKINQYIN